MISRSLAARKGFGTVLGRKRKWSSGGRRVKDLRQRGMGAIGAIIAMVIAGLIVYGIIYYGPEILKRIGRNSGRTSISELVNNPTQYDGEKVVVEGGLTTFGLIRWLVWEGDDYLEIILDMNTSYELGWGETGRVRVTGIFQAPNKILARKLEKA